MCRKSDDTRFLCGQSVVSIASLTRPQVATIMCVAMCMMQALHHTHGWVIYEKAHAVRPCAGCPDAQTTCSTPATRSCLPPGLDSVQKSIPLPVAADLLHSIYIYSHRGGIHT